MTRLRAGPPKNYGPIPINGKIFFLQRDQTDSETRPASYSVGCGASFSEYKAAGREAGQPPVSDAESKNECSYIRTLPCAFKAYIGATYRIVVGH